MLENIDVIWLMNEIIWICLVCWNCMRCNYISIMFIVYFWNMNRIVVVNVFNVSNMIVIVLCCLYDSINFWCIVYCIVRWCSCVSLIICVILCWINFFINMIKYIISILFWSI